MIFEIVKRPIEYLEVLNLSKNLITRISNETFEGLIRLRGLNLRKMVIFTFKNGDFDGENDQIEGYIDKNGRKGPEMTKND